MKESCLTLSDDNCRTLFEAAKKLVGDRMSLQLFANSRITQSLFDFAGDIFSAELPRIEENLADPRLGVIGVDIPVFTDNVEPSQEALSGAIVSLALTGAVMTPLLDVLNKTPFSLHNSSIENEKVLQKLELAFNTPSEKLGVHSDGVLRANGVYVPHTLMLYNLLLGYECPGSFYWTPMATWSERSRWAERIGVNRCFSFKPSPIVYGDSARGETTILHDQVIEAPIFWEDSCNSTVFLNGEVLGSEADREAVRAMKQSIGKAPRISISQRLRRMILVKNSAGFHSRDVFEKPFSTLKYTRSMIRCVDGAGFKVASKRVCSDEKLAAI